MRKKREWDEAKLIAWEAVLDAQRSLGGYGDEVEHGSADSAEDAKRAAIEAARRVLRESLGMLDALEGK